MITLGSGPICYGEGTFNRPNWLEANLPRFNERTREWFSKCIPYMRLHGQYLKASPGGMLMGMHNALSTTVGLAAVMHRMDPMTSHTVTLRSSDDSMSLYLTSDPLQLGPNIEIERKSLKLLGINLSLSKSMIFGKGYGEYTSWFQDGEFVAQYGVETSTLRPQGRNPMDDFYSIAKGAAVSQQRLEMNPMGAYSKIILGVDNCRRLWRIEKSPNQREGISGNVLLLADGPHGPQCAVI